MSNWAVYSSCFIIARKFTNCLLIVISLGFKKSSMKLFIRLYCLLICFKLLSPLHVKYTTNEMQSWKHYSNFPFFYYNFKIQKSITVNCEEIIQIGEWQTWNYILLLCYLWWWFIKNFPVAAVVSRRLIKSFKKHFCNLYHKSYCCAKL